jgi:enamine deaminase RidA (YjgF/YER057c/UK114 family)
MVALDDQGQVIGPGDMETQARNVFQQIGEPVPTPLK